jgi:hypothetical protein
MATFKVKIQRRAKIQVPSEDNFVCKTMFSFRLLKEVFLNIFYVGIILANTVEKDLFLLKTF